MEQINLYNNKKKYLLELIQQVEEMLQSLNMSKEKAMCETLLKRLLEDTFKVVVMGRFKVGKSTFINALLGSGDVLPAKSTPCTAIINEVKYSNEGRYAIIHFKHPIPTPMPKLAPDIKAYIERYNGKQIPPKRVEAKHINQFVVINDEAEDQKEGVAHTPFSRAEIFWDLPICEQGVEIIDTPGLEENIVRTEVTKSYLSQADAIIFVLDCTAPCSEKEMESIQEDILNAGHEYTIFVCNKINQIKEKEIEESKRYIRNKLCNKTKLGNEGIIFVNAEEAKDAKIVDDTTRYAHSGMLELEELLGSVLVNKRGNIKLVQPAKQLETAIEYAIATAIPNERQMLQTSTMVIQERLQKEMPNLENLKRQKEFLTIQLDTEISGICRETELLLQQRYNHIASRLPYWVNGITCTNSVSWNPLKVKQSIKDFTSELIENLQKKLTTEQEAWQKAELEPFVVSKLQALANRFQSQITNIFIDIEKIKLRIAGLEEHDTPDNFERISAMVAGYLGGGIGGAVVGGALGFSKEFVATIAAQVAVGVVLGTLLGLTNPITLTAILVTALVGMGLGLSKVEEKIKKKITEQVQNQLQSEKDESINKSVSIVNKKLKQGSSNIVEAIDRELKSVEDLVEQIKREKLAGEQKVQQRLAKLDHDTSLFKGLLASLQAFMTNIEKQEIQFDPLHVPDIPTSEEPSQWENTPIKENKPQDSSHHSQSPANKDEKVGCPNPNCPNYGQKVLPLTTKFCPECGSRIIAKTNAPEPTNPSYVIDPKLDRFEMDGVVYYKLDELHEDNRCGGHLYVGNNAIFICSKCGKRNRAENTPETLKIVSAILSKDDVSMDWYIEFINSLNISEDK